MPSPPNFLNPIYRSYSIAQRVGIAGLQRNTEQHNQYKKVGSKISEEDVVKMKEQLEIFKANLETFARKHKKDINKDPQLRKHFQVMCASIGVDPLASNKGFWAEMLGVGDFYYELGVQAIQVCMREQARTGGLILLPTLQEHLQQLRGKKSNRISKNDIELAVKKMKALGNGFDIIKIGSQKLVQSIPYELSTDHMTIMVLAQEKYFVTASQLLGAGWSRDRIRIALNQLLGEGMIWIDDQATEREYWFPSLLPEQ